MVINKTLIRKGAPQKTPGQFCKNLKPMISNQNHPQLYYFENNGMALTGFNAL